MVRMTNGSDGTSARRSPRRLAVPVAILVVTAVLIAAVLWLRPAEEPSADEARAPTAPVDPADLAHPSEVASPDLGDAETRDPEDPLAEGPVDAPVALVVFTDYQCPYCARWTEDTLPALRDHVDRGELRIEWRDVNVYGEDSARAARASLAAALQGRHADYHQALFAGGRVRPAGELDEDSLIALATEQGLDVDRFTADLRSEEVARTVDEHAAEGVELGVVTTPSFVLAGTPVVGAQPTEVFLDQVDAALEEAGD
jgi:protein-disulfide isomerase